MLTSIAWNKHGWEEVDAESRTGHEYTQDHIGHESLNFAFDKPNLDDRTHVYGYSPGMKRVPRQFLQPGIVFFYSKNYDGDTDHIVGVYGNARRIEWVGRPGTELGSNIVAEREYSARFPKYLDAKSYKRPDRRRVVSRIGITYIDRETARRIMDDVITEAGGADDERLRRIRSLVDDERADDEAEQERVRARVGRSGSLTTKMHWEPVPRGDAQYAAKVRRRDNENVAFLKEWFNHQCQICGTSIVRAHGPPYVEAAHIRPKSEDGSEVPSNILILCPNHHKEFDYGDRKITEHTDDIVRFTLNGTDHLIEFVPRKNSTH